VSLRRDHSQLRGVRPLVDSGTIFELTQALGPAVKALEWGQRRERDILELLNVKKELERELETLSLNCTRCSLDVHWCPASASSADTGRTGSQRRTGNQRSRYESLFGLRR